MNQAKYTILLDNFTSCVLLGACENTKDNLEAQLRKEAEKKRKCFGLFYQPTKGLELHPAFIDELSRIVISVTGLPDLKGYISVNEGTANLLKIALMMCRAAGEKNMQSADAAKQAELKKVIAALDAMMLQLPFNDTKTDGGMFYTSIT
jgi:hypothetical protein